MQIHFVLINLQYYLNLFFYSAIVNFTKFRGSRQHVYDNAIAEVVRFHFHMSFLNNL